MRSLSELNKYFNTSIEASSFAGGEANPRFEYLQSDSRKVERGEIFVAIKGLHSDGRAYIKKAQDNGAVAYIYKEAPTDEQLEGVTIPGFALSNSRSFARLASWFYGDPSSVIKVLGVTGTNGKSTTTWLLSQILNNLGYKCAVIGTLGTGFLPHLQKSANTTPDGLALQRCLYDLMKAGASYAAMEVSSIGICEKRIEGIRFFAVGFTNLTRDHLDYHGTMEEYYQAKKKLFLNDVPMCINESDEYGKRLLREIVGTKILGYRCGTFISNQNENSVFVQKNRFLSNGIDLQISYQSCKARLVLPLLGSFNAENYACALSLLLSADIDFDSIIKASKDLKPVTGRMECFKGENKPSIVVDYAHTPDGVEQVLKASREHHPGGHIFIVLGCGGDRDKGKRPIMAIKASVFADTAVFTSDNPRTEDPEAILRDMQYGVASAQNCEFIVDRRKAIDWAFAHAGKDDCIVIAGKGHEDYQIFKNETIHFSDREIAAELSGVELK